MNIETYPNQRRVTIHKCETRKNYSKVDIQANKNAMRVLGYSAYMLYMYFCMNATAFQVICSKVAICNETGLSKNVYYNAFEKLVDNGYLVCKEGTKCLFDFYESPKPTRAQTPESGKPHPPISEHASQKQVENIYNIENNIARKCAKTHSPGVKDTGSITSSGRTKKRLFIDI